MQPSALVVHEALRTTGDAELARRGRALLWSGIAGGLTMGLSMVGSGLLHAHLPAAPWRILLTSFGFTLGFVVVIIGRQGLITEHALTGVLPLLARPSRAALGKVLRLWGLVLAGNVIGATLFAIVAARTGVFEPEAHAAFKEIGHRALAVPLPTQLLRAVLAGWLIGLAMWSLTSAGTGRAGLIVLIVWVVGAAGFAHIISGSIEVLFVVLAGEASLADFVAGFFLPVLIGNLFGGAVLVATLNHLQVAPEQRRAYREHGLGDRGGAPHRPPHDGVPQGAD